MHILQGIQKYKLAHIDWPPGDYVDLYGTLLGSVLHLTAVVLGSHIDADGLIQFHVRLHMQRHQCGRLPPVGSGLPRAEQSKQCIRDFFEKLGDQNGVLFRHLFHSINGSKYLR